MKTLFLKLSLLLACTANLQGQTYTNFIRQVQYPDGIQYDVSVASNGEQLSSLAINPGGARFELWTVKSSPLTSYLLATQYVGTYVPLATVALRSEDSYAPIRRTRADRPFYVDVTVSGLLSGASDPVASKSVTFLHHVQSYGAGGNGDAVDRSAATLLEQSTINTNGSQTLTYAVNSVPGAVRTKVRGEQRFSVYSLADTNAPASELASKFIQIWPVADASIAGIVDGQLLRFLIPQLTLTLNDLYPNSSTYAQVYKGAAVLGTSGAIVPGSSFVVSDTVPLNKVLTITNWESVLTSDGQWTMEIVTVTPFGVERLTSVTFNVNRTIKVNGNVTTIN